MSKKPFVEGNVKKGGVSPPPTKPKPNMTPSAQSSRKTTDIFVVGCDVDGQSHGCFDDAQLALEKAASLIKNQPFDLDCNVDDVYIQRFKVNTSDHEIIPLVEFKLLLEYEQTV